MLGFLFDSTGRLAAEVSTLSQPKSLLASHGVTVDGVAHQGQWAEYRDACVASVGTILVDVQRTIPKSEFCGVGLLVCRDTSALPMCPLSGERTVRDTANVVDAICSASMLSHPQHDGFHILSPSLALTHTNQYIAPPVPPDFFSGVSDARFRCPPHVGLACELVASGDLRCRPQYTEQDSHLR